MSDRAGPDLGGVMGWPVGHSLSPDLHGFWLERYACSGYYVPLAVRPERLGDAIRALPALGFSGINITLPHKESALAEVDRVEATACRIGAINLVVVDRKGGLEGRNTDAYGFLAHLQASLQSWRETTSTALILGAGGAARAAAVALLEAGLAHIYLVNRTQARAQQLVTSLDSPRVQSAPWPDRSSLLKEVGLLVNTTTLGMQGNPPLRLPLSLMPESAIVYDIVYRPLETQLLADARACGLCAVDGLGMLIHQAVPAFEVFFGCRPEADEAVRNRLLARLEAL